MPNSVQTLSELFGPWYSTGIKHAWFRDEIIGNPGAQTVLFYLWQHEPRVGFFDSALVREVFIEGNSSVTEERFRFLLDRMFGSEPKDGGPYCGARRPIGEKTRKLLHSMLG